MTSNDRTIWAAGERPFPQNIPQLLECLQRKFQKAIETWIPHQMGGNHIQEPDLHRRPPPASKPATSAVDNTEVDFPRTSLPFFEKAPPVVEDKRAHAVKAKSKKRVEEEQYGKRDAITIAVYASFSFILWGLNRRRSPNHRNRYVTGGTGVCAVEVPQRRRMIHFSQARGVPDDDSPASPEGGAPDIIAQLHESLKRIEATLATRGMTLQRHLVHLTVFLTHDGQVPAYEQALKRHNVSCTTSVLLVRSLVTAGALCEMEGYAAK